VLGGAISAYIRQTKLAEYAADYCNFAAALLCHQFGYALGEPYISEIIDFHNVAVNGIVSVDGFGFVGNAGIIHQYINASECLGGLLYGGIRLRAVADVQRQHIYPLRVALAEDLQRLLAARRHYQAALLLLQKHFG